MVAPVIAAIASAAAAAPEATKQIAKAAAGAISGGGEAPQQGTSSISIDASANAGATPVHALLGSHRNEASAGSPTIKRVKRRA